MPPSQGSVQNQLLGALSADDFGALQAYLEPVSLKLLDVLVEPSAPIEHVYFVEAGLASMIVIGSDGERIEVAHIGREGMSGETLILGVDRSPNQTFIQVAGSAFRLEAAELARAMEASAPLRGLLQRYLQTAITQIGHSALANGRYTIQERLARWLLMCHDRADGDDLPLTHQFLSLMLGVRRSGVTEALHVLEGVQIVRAHRGRVAVLDRGKLEEIAGACYGLPEREYQRLIG